MREKYVEEESLCSPKVEEFRSMLGQFDVIGDMALQQIDTLSGGQKSRVTFAVLCGHKPNLPVPHA